MENEIKEFLTRVILSSESVDYQIRSEALELLLKNAREESTKVLPTIDIFYDDRPMRQMSIPKEKYNNIVKHLQNHELISAIKELRAFTSLGLREAKITVEALRDKLGIIK